MNISLGTWQTTLPPTTISLKSHWICEGMAKRPGKSRSLDKHGSIASPAQADGEGRKAMRHRLRRASGQILNPLRVEKSWRVCFCGQRAIGSLVSLHKSGSQGHFGSVETCGSIWTCPVCAAKITEKRREQIDHVLTQHFAVGGTAYMATLTVPHDEFQTCHELRSAVSDAWRGVKTGKAWGTIKEQVAWLGDIRALEITHGGSGWHPHLHVLVLFKPEATGTAAKAFGGWLYDAWARSVKRQGLGDCSPNAFKWDVVDGIRGAADYVGKWGAALELTKAHTKKGRGGRTPWQILSDFADNGEFKDAELFREYAAASKGSNQLTWSRDIRRVYALPNDVSDEELAVEPSAPETQVANMDGTIFKAVVARKATAQVLSALERGGIEAVGLALTRLHIPWRLSNSPGFQRDTYVPLFIWGRSPESPGDKENCGFSCPGPTYYPKETI